MTDILDRAPKAIAVLTTCTLLMTIIHDWGYFSIIGSELQSLQTPYDYLANALAWLPFSLAFFTSTFVLSRGFHHLRRRFGASTLEGGFGSHRANITRKSVKRTLFFLVSASLIYAVYAFLNMPSDFSELWIFVASSLLSVTIGMEILKLYGRGQKPNFVIAMSVMLFPALAATLYTFGSLEARRDLRAATSVYQIILKDGRSQMLKVLRNLDKGPLVYDFGRQRTSLLRWDQIDRLEHFVSTRHEEPPACKYFGWRCVFDAPNP